VLAAAAYCAPQEAIPPGVLRAGAGLEKEEGFDEAVTELAELGLLELTGGGPVIHVLIAEYVRRVGEANEAVLERVAKAVEEEAPAAWARAYRGGEAQSGAPGLAAAWRDCVSRTNVPKWRCVDPRCLSSSEAPG
jgi:hypothetical protein